MNDPRSGTAHDLGIELSMRSYKTSRWRGCVAWQPRGRLLIQCAREVRDADTSTGHLLLCDDFTVEALASRGRQYLDDPADLAASGRQRSTGSLYPAVESPNRSSADRRLKPTSTRVRARTRRGLLTSNCPRHVVLGRWPLVGRRIRDSRHGSGFGSNMPQAAWYAAHSIDC